MHNKKLHLEEMEAFALNDPQNVAIKWNQHYITVKGVRSQRFATH